MPRRSWPDRRPRLDGKARARPVERCELGPADAVVRLLRGEPRRQLERVEIARDGRGNRVGDGDALDGARHVGRALEEALHEIGRHRGPRAVRMRGDVGLGRGARLRVRSRAAERLAHAAEQRRRATRGCPRSEVASRARPCARSRRGGRRPARSPRSTPRTKSGCAGRRRARAGRSGCRRAPRCPPRAAGACGTPRSRRSRSGGTPRSRWATRRTRRPASRR